MKKVFKYIGIFVVLLLLGIAVFVGISHKSLPTGQSGDKADAMALKMMNALNYDAWENQSWVAWSFIGFRDYEWDKFKSQVTAEWNGNRVVFDTRTGKGEAYENEQLKGHERDELIATAIANFNNDSFWLYAPFKAFEDGCERSIVTNNKGEEGLLIHYPSGGTTPGDSYLWYLDQEGRPERMEMWTSIIPIGGVSTTWGNWKQLSSGAWIATDHEMGPINIEIENLRSN